MNVKGLKTGYPTNDSEGDELPFALGDKRGSGHAVCIFLDGLFSEIWIRCYKCGSWAHFECTGMEKEVLVRAQTIPSSTSRLKFQDYMKLDLLIKTKRVCEVISWWKLSADTILDIIFSSMTEFIYARKRKQCSLCYFVMFPKMTFSKRDFSGPRVVFKSRKPMNDKHF